MEGSTRAVRRVVAALGVVLASVAVSRGGSLVTLTLPLDVSREAVLRRDPVALARLRALATARPATRERQGSVEGGLDQVVMFVDQSGRAVMPDHDAAISSAVPGTAPRRLRFKFDSPDLPWTREQVHAMRRIFRQCHRIARMLYGDPAFRITVNVRQGDTGPYSGLYFPPTNEMIINASWKPTTICHEMVHAFHDDYVADLATFEEGMTTAMEVELMARISTDVVFGNLHHVGDAYHDLLNSHVMGVFGGNFVTGTNQFLRRRYDLAGYAWAKPFIEDEGFFRAFNRELYARMAADPTTRGNEAALVAIAEAAAPTVEGQPFLAWYAGQGVFDTDPPRGYFVTYFPPGFPGQVEFFRRLPSGAEVVQPDATVTLEARDAQGAVLASTSVVTDEFGNAYPFLDLGAYSGRFTVRADTASPDGPVSTTLTLSPYGLEGSEDRGVIGIVPDRESGTVVVTPVAPAGPPVAVPLVNGGFRAPELETARGQFEVSYTEGARTVTKLFTKDAASYFVALPGIDPTTTTSTSTSTTLPPVPVVMVPNTHLIVKDDSFPPVKLDRRKIEFKSTGDKTAMALPAFGSLGDPTVAGATLTVYNAAGKPTRVTVPLPAASWSAPDANMYTYRDIEQLLGPVWKAKVKPGFVKVKASGAKWGYRLDDPPEGAIAVRFRLGDGVEWCAVFPPKNARSDRLDKFLGSSSAETPAVCPPVP